jgi:hypothetical protein
MQPGERYFSPSAICTRLNVSMMVYDKIQEYRQVAPDFYLNDVPYFNAGVVRWMQTALVEGPDEIPDAKRMAFLEKKIAVEKAAKYDALVDAGDSNG